MSLTREIITLQLGNYANYVGTHWWNIQETGFTYDTTGEPADINHDVLFREGVDFRGATTYTPRLVLADLKGSLNHLLETGDLYADKPMTVDEPENKYSSEKQGALWDSECVEVVESDAKEKPEYLKDLDETGASVEKKNYNFRENVETWTDFMYSRYHPKTINLIREFEHSPTENKFDTFSNGQLVWKQGNFEEQYSDNIRQYLEECNNCQGFQVIFDCTDGFSGLTSKCLEMLEDEYGKSIFAIPLISPKSVNFQNSDGPMSDSIRTVNIALSYCNLIEHSSVFIPLSTMARGWRTIGNKREFPDILYDENNLYHTSAILATYLDSVSLRYRIRNPTQSNYLAGFCTDINNYGRKLAGAALALPFQMNSTEDLIDCLDNFNGPIFTQLSPNTEIGTDRIIQSTCVRGIPTSRLKRPAKSDNLQMRMAAFRCNSISEMFQLYFQCNNNGSMAHVSSIQNGMPTKLPYPIEIFHKNINYEGFRSDYPRPDELNVSSVPTVATVQVSNDLANTLESLHREAERIKIAKISRFKQAGYETEDYKEMLNCLLEFKDNYDDHFEL